MGILSGGIDGVPRTAVAIVRVDIEAGQASLTILTRPISKGWAVSFANGLVQVKVKGVSMGYHGDGFQLGKEEMAEWQRQIKAEWKVAQVVVVLS